MADGNVGYGQQWPSDSGSDLNNVAFVVRQMIARLETMRLVQVKAVHGNGDVAAPGTVDVLPLVNQADGGGYSKPHGTVYGIPWWRLQGGGSAVICDPEVGDIGFVAVSNRDISKVKATRAQADPGSYRRFDLADGVYVGALLGNAPTKYVLFASDRIEVKHPAKITSIVGSASATLTTTSSTLAFGSNSVVIDSTGIHFNGPTFFNGVASGPTTGGTVDFGSAVIKTSGAAQVGSVASSGDVVGGGKSLTSHIHGGVIVGGGNTGPPV